MNITFVHFGREHLGIEYLSAVLKQDGHGVDLVCDPGLFSKEDNVLYSPFLERMFRKKDIVSEIERKKPDVVAFSVYTTTYRWACEIARAVKECMSVPVVFGGIHTTLVPELAIENPYIDYVFVGESEYAFLDFVHALEDHKDIEGICNIYYKKNGQLMHNRLSEPIENLDRLPFPDKELFADYVRYKDDYMILTSRGCPNSCSYCCESYLNSIYRNRYFRRRSVNSVIEELAVMKKKYSTREVMFFDSIFFSDKAWLREFLGIYNREIGVPFRCIGHAGFLDYEIAKLMKDAGCYCIDFGVQTFNQSIRRDILNRKETNNKIKEAFDICDKTKIRYDIDLMLGIPMVKEEDYLSTINFIKSSKYLNRLKCYYLSYFPRLTIIDKAREMGILENGDILDIETGKIGDWFHLDSIKDAQHRRWKDDFQKFYKIYPIIPSFLLSFIVKNKIYRLFHLIPNILVIFIQLIIAIQRKDYRFNILIKNYLFRLSHQVFFKKKNYKNEYPN